MTALSIYIGSLTFLGFLYIESMRPSVTIPRMRHNSCDLFVAFLLIGDLIQSHLFLSPRTNALTVLDSFSIGNISAIIWTAIAGLYLVYILVTGRFRIEWYFRTPYFSIFVLILIYLLSSAWSIVPMFSLYRGLELMVWICLSVYFFTRLHSLIQTVTLLAIYCFTWFLLNIPIFIEALSHNIIFSSIKDNLLPIVGLSVLVLGWRTRSRLVFCVIGVTTIVLAGSAASVASGLAACSVGLMLRRNTIIKLAGCIGLIASLSFIFVYLVEPDQFPEIIDALSSILQKSKEELLSATGRYTIWSIFWDAAKDNYFGTGFGSDRFIQLVGNMDEVTEGFNTTNISIMSAHNAALSAWVSAGWPGVVALFFVFLNGIRYTLNCDTNQRATATMVLVFIVLNNLTIPGLGSGYSCIWLAWIAVLSVADRRSSGADSRRAIFNNTFSSSSVLPKGSVTSSRRRTGTGLHPVRLAPA